MTAYNVVSPTALVAGQPEDISVVLANFNAIASVVNGNLDDANVKAGAGIGLGKLSQGGATVGQVVTWNGTAWAAAPIAGNAGVVGYGTSLPASPGDGQEYILVDSMTNPTYHWRFRYNAGDTNTDKWEFIGGISMSVLATTTVSTASTTDVAIDGTTPSFTVPRNGVYEVDWGSINYNSVANQSGTIPLYLGSVAQAEAVVITTAVNQWAYTAKRWRLAATAGGVLQLRYRVSGGTGGFFSRQLNVLPVRVS